MYDVRCNSILTNKLMHILPRPHNVHNRRFFECFFFLVAAKKSIINTITLLSILILRNCLLTEVKSTKSFSETNNFLSCYEVNVLAVHEYFQF